VDSEYKLCWHKVDRGYNRGVPPLFPPLHLSTSPAKLDKVDQVEQQSCYSLSTLSSFAGEVESLPLRGMYNRWKERWKDNREYKNLKS
jgi:hypothetical protein